MTVISSPTYDPTTTATKLANAYVADAKTSLDNQSTSATATATALTTLGTALSAFQSTLTALTSSTKTVAATTATFSDSSIATATATTAAAAGTYSFYVQQLATAGQVSYNVSDSSSTNPGAMNVTLADGSSFEVDLANADSNMDGKLSAKEIAAAINTAADNDSRVTASTLTVNGQSKLVLTSDSTGADNAVASIDTSGLADSGLAAAMSAPTTLTTAKDAIVWLGGTSGTKVQQASNTFSIVDGVKFTVTAAQSATASPITMTVASDNSGTATNVQSFITAYNTLVGVFTSLTAAGDHSDSTNIKPDAAFYNDAGVKSLQDRLAGALRAITGGQSLINYGISANRDGTLTLDSARLNKAVAANPSGLDTLFGRAGVGVEAGALGKMDTLINSWTSASTGYISTRQQVITKLQSDLVDRQAAVQTQFDNAYKRYLAQFTALANLQSSMTSTSDMFTAMFSSSSS